MNIQFFGHSIFGSSYKYGRENNEPKTFVEYINEKYNIEGKYIAIPTISQERILMEVKKYKTPMDFAIISHPGPMSVYFPSWNHDFEDAKIPDENIRYWTENKENQKFLFSKGKFFTERTMDSSELTMMHWSEVHKHLMAYKELHYHPDLQKNRAAGALIQVVDYLKAKNIKAIHLVRSHDLPSWFKFTHGIVDTEIQEFKYDSRYATSHSKSLNGITEEGNIIIARKLVDYIENYEEYAIEHNTEK